MILFFGFDAWCCCWQTTQACIASGRWKNCVWWRQEKKTYNKIDFHSSFTLATAAHVLTLCDRYGDRWCLSCLERFCALHNFSAVLSVWPDKRHCARIKSMEHWRKRTNKREAHFNGMNSFRTFSRAVECNESTNVAMQMNKQTYTKKKFTKWKYLNGLQVV